MLLRAGLGSGGAAQTVPDHQVLHYPPLQRQEGKDLVRVIEFLLLPPIQAIWLVQRITIIKTIEKKIMVMEITMIMLTIVIVNY